MIRKKKKDYKHFGQFYVVTKLSKFIARVDPYFCNIKDTHVNYVNKNSCTAKDHNRRYKNAFTITGYMKTF